MICNQCGADGARHAKFCAACGAAQSPIVDARARPKSEAPANDWSALKAWRPQLAFAAKLSPEEARASVLVGAGASALIAGAALAGMAHFSVGRLMAILLFTGAAAIVWRTSSILAVLAAAIGLVMLMVVSARLGAGTWLLMEVVLMALLAGAARGAAALTQGPAPSRDLSFGKARAPKDV